jgi:hypothetical protein
MDVKDTDFSFRHISKKKLRTARSHDEQPAHLLVYTDGLIDELLRPDNHQDLFMEMFVSLDMPLPKDDPQVVFNIALHSAKAIFKKSSEGGFSYIFNRGASVVDSDVLEKTVVTFSEDGLNVTIRGTSLIDEELDVNDEYVLESLFIPAKMNFITPEYMREVQRKYEPYLYSTYDTWEENSPYLPADIKP